MSLNTDLIINGLSDLLSSADEIAKKKDKLLSVINEINSINSYREKLTYEISRLEDLKSRLSCYSIGNIDTIIIIIDLKIYELREKIESLKPISLLRLKYNLKKDIDLMEKRNNIIDHIISSLANDTK